MPADDARLSEHHERITSLESRMTVAEQAISSVGSDVRLMAGELSTNTILTKKVAKGTEDLVQLSRSMQILYKLAIALGGLFGVLVAFKEVTKYLAE